MNPVAVPTARSELTPEEEWRLRRRPQWARAACLVAVLTGIGCCASDALSARFIALAWHPTRAYEWRVCGEWREHGRAVAIYSRHPKGCRDALRAPFDCAATCEGLVGARDWVVCEPRCPAERLERTRPWP